MSLYMGSLISLSYVRQTGGYRVPRTVTDHGGLIIVSLPEREFEQLGVNTEAFKGEDLICDVKVNCVSYEIP